MSLVRKAQIKCGAIASVAIDGYLINVSALVIGSTIRQVADMPLEGWSFCHVELA